MFVVCTIILAVVSLTNIIGWMTSTKKGEKRAKFWNFFETFFDNLTEKVQQQIDNVQKEKLKKKGEKTLKRPYLRA